MMRVIKRVAALLAASGLLGVLAVPAAQAEDDPALQQTVNENEVIAPLGESTVVQDGHIDLGPLMINGKMDFLARDDRGAQPVWRHLEDIVFEVGQSAVQTLPEGGAYDFTGASAGQSVWVVPQTQIASVPWIGWSTQSPEVTRQVDRGVNLEYHAHQGDGQFTLFLQAGNFGDAKQLWSSAKKEPQAVWVDLKTHTHANWVFTKPGVHLLAVTLKAKMLDGTEVSVPKVLRFAVGGASVEDARQAKFNGLDEEGNVIGQTTSAPTDAGKAVDGPNATGQGGSNSGISPLLWVTIAMLAVGILAGLAAAFVFRRARRAEAAATAKLYHQGASSTGATGSETHARSEGTDTDRHPGAGE